MNDPRGVLSAAILLFAFAMGAGAFGVFSYIELGSPPVAAVRAVTEWPTVPQPSVEPARAITVTHDVKGDRHTIRGELLLSNACTELVTEAISHDTTPPSVTIAFSTTTEDDAVLCGAAESPTHFSITFDAPEDVLITASWKGEDAILSLIK